MAPSLEKLLGKIWDTKWQKAQETNKKKFKRGKHQGGIGRKQKYRKKVHEKEKQSRRPGQTDIKKYRDCNTTAFNKTSSQLQVTQPQAAPSPPNHGCKRNGTGK